VAVEGKKRHMAKIPVGMRSQKHLRRGASD
jgi:hypothetical protein